MKMANRSGLLTIPGLPRPALILLAAAMLLLLLAVAHPAEAAESIDYDTDDDGLIEIHNLAQLNNIRWDADGDGQLGTWRGMHDGKNRAAGTPTYEESFPNAAEGMGCPDTGCRGYELMADLDFDSNGDGSVTADDHDGAYWKGGSGWFSSKIGAYGRPYSAEFNGNGHTISNLFINMTDWHKTNGSTREVGLFGRVTGTIRNLGVINADIGVDRDYAGIIASSLSSGGSVRNSYTTGKIHQLDPHPLNHNRIASPPAGWSD